MCVLHIFPHTNHQRCYSYTPLGRKEPNRIDLQALTLAGPNVTRPVPDPLAVLSLDNRLSITIKNMLLTVVSPGKTKHVVETSYKLNLVLPLLIISLLELKIFSKKRNMLVVYPPLFSIHWHHKMS